MDRSQDQGEHDALSQDAETEPTRHHEVPTEARHEDGSHSRSRNEPPPKTVASATDDWRWPDYVGLFFNGLATVAAVVGVVFLVLQWKQTESALAESKRANDLTQRVMERSVEDGNAQDARAEQQLTVARQNAAATLDAVDVARRANANAVAASRAELRPWLVLKSIQAREIARAQTSVSIHAVITNVGRSPALSVDFGNTYTGVGHWSSDGPPQLPPGPLRMLRVFGGGLVTRTPTYFEGDILAPDEVREATLEAPLGEGRFDALLRRESFVFVNSRATYADTYGTVYTLSVCLASDNLRADTERISVVNFRPYGADCNKAQ